MIGTNNSAESTRTILSKNLLADKNRRIYDRSNVSKYHVSQIQTTPKYDTKSHCKSDSCQTLFVVIVSALVS